MVPPTIIIYVLTKSVNLKKKILQEERFYVQPLNKQLMILLYLREQHT